MFDLVIKSNRTITPSGMMKATVLVRNGVIDAVVTDDSAEGVENVIDVGDHVLMPGVLDTHVHINEPGHTDWEGFDTATRAALAGGVTTLVDMPLNSIPVTTTPDAFDVKCQAAMQYLHCDCGLWGGIIPGNEKEIIKLAKKGVVGYKAFLIHSGIDEFPNVTEADLRKAMPLISTTGLPLLVHCELAGKEEYSLTSAGSYKEYVASRPKRWENDAITLMIRLCREYNCKTHIVHLSSAESLEQLQVAKEEGLPISVETAPHYLFFNSESIKDGSTEFKCAPPIRERLNNEQLLNALRTKIIDFVATDHSPAPPSMKKMDTGSFAEAWGGIASLQFSLPALWTLAKKQSFTPEDIARWLCSNPSMLTRELNMKGHLAAGYDADMVVWDPEASFVVDREKILHRHQITPYLGEELYGVVLQTYLSGNKIFDKGKFLHLNKGRMLLNKYTGNGN